MSKKLLKILVVEDDSLDREIIRRALKASGIQHEFYFAEDHESGREATNGKEYDCIFLDYNLPGGTGLELLKEIRDSDNRSPIIIITSLGDEKLAVEAIKLGADDYLPKKLLAEGDGIGQSIRHMLKGRENAKRQFELEKQLKETQKQLRTVVANAPIIIFSLDTKAEFTLFEGKGLESLAIDKEKVFNKSLDENKDLPISKENYLLAINGEEHTAVVEWKNKFFEIFYSPIRDERKIITGVIGIASDITGHKHAEGDLKKAKQLAEETALIKEQFLTNMSHEVRTPMNGIVGLTRILLNTSLSSEQLRYVQAIKTSSDNLLVILNDILDFSKIEAGKMKFENVPFIIDEIANQTIELFQSKADEKSLSLILEKDPKIPIYLNGDPTRLSQIMNNLVSNAIKFTEKGDVRMILKLVTVDKKNIKVSFEIRDTGIGIPEKSLPTIFDSFTQASSDTTRKFGGTGLGLTIVKRLIDLQNGDINLKSKPGQGTSFTFTLPFTVAINEKNSDEVETIENLNLNTSHLRILIAEDNKINQMVVKKVFSEWNTHADIADNGVIALEMLRNFHYDLVLMDIQMPHMDGYTAVQKIRNEFPEPKRSIPIMAMTAHATSTEKQKCLNAEMDDYISKPFEPLDLKKKILALTKSVQPPLKGEVNERTASMNFHSKLSDSSGSPQETDGLSAQKSAESLPHLKENGQKINLSYLKRISEGNQAFVIEMIEMFLNKTPVALDQINDCYQKQNWEELKKIIHRIKPSFAYIGMQDLQKTLGKIESWSDEIDDKKTVRDLIKEVESRSLGAFEQLKKELGLLK